jgi:hypothetical protein
LFNNILNLLFISGPGGRMLRSLFNRLFPDHEWEDRANGEMRVCRICGREDELDLGGGMSGSQWVNIAPGRKEAHGIAPELIVSTARQIPHDDDQPIDVLAAS